MVRLASPSMLTAAAAVWPTASERQRAKMLLALDEHAQRDMVRIIDAMVQAVRAERAVMAGVLLGTSTEDDIAEAAAEVGMSESEFRAVLTNGDEVVG